MNIEFTKVFTKANHLTHAGKFHADEVFATVILSKCKDNIILSRVEKIEEDRILPDAFIYDIGGGKFDHHQKGGNGTRPNTKGEEVKYASCGLVWKEFGHAVVTAFLEKNYKLMEVSSFYEIKDEDINNLVTRIDQNFIQGIDGNDNGQEIHVESAYMPTTLAQIIDNFNPDWNESVDPDKCFMQAVEAANTIFDRMLHREVSKFAAKSIVEEAIEESEDGIMILDRYMTWEEALHESTNPKAKNINFVVHPSKRNGFNIRAVSANPNEFKNRKDLPKAWGGLQGEDLQKVTGIKTASFCHNALFLAVAEDKEDAIAMAYLANEE